MHEIKAKSANHALAEGIRFLRDEGVRETSRNGGVVVAPCPVMVTYLEPWKRVLMSPTRDANPFFHLMEALWMLNGNNDLKFLQKFVHTFDRYSDDGVTLHGAYGHRWRRHFGMDQLEDVVEELRRSPDSRRAVVQMWDPRADLSKLHSGGRDVPCNTQIYFDLRGGGLNMTVTNRSNDAIYGCFGANLVHFSILLEYVAAWLGVPMGRYRQFTNNLHFYTDVFSTEKLLQMEFESNIRETPAGHPLVSTEIGSWDADLCTFMHAGTHGTYRDPFFTDVAVPMLAAHELHKVKAPSSAVLSVLQSVKADDWRTAAMEWAARRAK